MREKNISNSIFISMSMCCGGVKTPSRSLKSDQFSQFLKTTWLHVSNVYLVNLSACVAFKITRTRIWVMLKLHSLKSQRTTNLFMQIGLFIILLQDSIGSYFNYLFFLYENKIGRTYIFFVCFVLSITKY